MHLCVEGEIIQMVRNPLVSILIPVFNREEVILETLDSALSQTYKNFELVVVDNCSSDRTWELLKGYAVNDPRVKVFRNSSNVGPVNNWRECVRRASGEYAKILWSDDLIAPDYLEKTVPYLNDIDVGFVFSAVELFNQNKRWGAYSIGKTGVYSSAEFIRWSLLSLGLKYPVSPGAALFRLKDIAANLVVDVPNKIRLDFSSTAIGNDLLIYLLTASQYPNFAFVDERLSYFRSHPDSITVKSSPKKLRLYYKVASAYFADKCLCDGELKSKFNSTLLLLSIGLNGEVDSIDDFYPDNKRRTISWSYFGRIILLDIFVYKPRTFIGQLFRFFMRFKTGA